MFNVLQLSSGNLVTYCHCVITSEGCRWNAACRFQLRLLITNQKLKKKLCRDIYICQLWVQARCLGLLQHLKQVWAGLGPGWRPPAGSRFGLMVVPELFPHW